jgi:cell division protein FtsW (lipid II flippase)
MESFDRIKKYSQTVCEQIRWKKAHAYITEEIENHIIDQRDAYIGQGMPEDQAMDETISQMGDPVTVGAQLDSTHRPKPQWRMISLTAMLLFMGLFINTYLLNGTNSDSPVKIVSSMCIGIGLMLIAYFMDFTFIGKYPRLFYFSIVVVGAITVILSPKNNGRAFYSMYFALLFPVALAAIIYWARNKGYIGIILCGIAFMLPAIITLIVPTISVFVLFTITGLVLLSIAIAKDWFNINKIFGYVLVFLPTILTLCFAAIQLITSPYRLRRIAIAFNPSLDPAGGGWQSIVARALLDNSKFIGSGTMPAQYSGTQYFPLPGFDTDFMLTYLVFKIGWIGFVVIMAVLMFFIIAGFVHCLKQKSILGSLVSTSVMLTFTLQVIGYVISNLGFQLLSPISLPLVSFGGTATIINLVLIGIMLSVFKNGDIVRDKNNVRYDKERFITWCDGKLIITFGKKPVS